MRELVSRGRKVAGLGLTVGSLWQIWEAIMALMNGWRYAFPFMLVVVEGQAIWAVMDFWIMMILVAYFLGSL